MESVNNIKPQRTYDQHASDSHEQRLYATAGKEEAAPAIKSTPSSAADLLRNEKAEKIAENIRDYVSSAQTDLQIQIHEGTGKIMIRVISREDGRVIREVPPEELLNLAARMEQMAGILFDKRA